LEEVIAGAPLLNITQEEAEQLFAEIDKDGSGESPSSFFLRPFPRVLGNTLIIYYINA